MEQCITELFHKELFHIPQDFLDVLEDICVGETSVYNYLNLDAILYLETKYDFA